MRWFLPWHRHSGEKMFSFVQIIACGVLGSMRFVSLPTGPIDRDVE